MYDFVAYIYVHVVETEFDGIGLADDAADTFVDGVFIDQTRGGDREVVSSLEFEGTCFFRALAKQGNGGDFARFLYDE